MNLDHLRQAVSLAEQLEAAIEDFGIYGRNDQQLAYMEEDAASLRKRLEVMLAREESNRLNALRQS